MFSICCTAKLLKRAGFPAEPPLPEPTTALGNWYANILRFGHRQLILFVSERSRLAVVTPAKEARFLVSHLSIHLSVLLERLHARPGWIAEEILQMTDVHYTVTNSRSVLGTMNDYKAQIGAILSCGNVESEIEISLLLSECPAGPLKYNSPDLVTIDLLRRQYDND